MIRKTLDLFVAISVIIFVASCIRIVSNQATCNEFIAVGSTNLPYYCEE